ncbi:MAG: B12-binding domain-containing radical SAM protein [Myxococcales bacterium]|nr:B12-binding domain-containing radical SAM protein [Myxococcales bacterium]
MRIALISMPWQDPLSPSIQLGTLKAWMERHRPDIEVDTYELFLELADAVGIHLAKRISVSWVGEALFAYIFFPERANAIAHYLESSRNSDPAFRELDFGSVIETLRSSLLDRLDRTDWSQYRLVGFSVVFAQMIPSLLAAREVKRRAPSTDIVLGGPSCTNLIGKTLLKEFPFLDYVVNGEGESPLLNLTSALEKTAPGETVEVKAVVHRNSPEAAFGEVDQLPNMADLPPPNYDGYFRTLRSCGNSQEEIGRIRIPVETSRGCWWDRSHVDPMLSCTFCNLNLQWHGYREKPVQQSIEDIRELARKYECPDFTVVDNILRHREADGFIEALTAIGGGLDFWMEARASVHPDQIRRLSRAGARVVQFGIEALSTSVLEKMVKGTTTLQNLQAMKFCEQYGIKNTANLIVDYPGMDEADIAETLTNIAFARGYRPLDIADFSLVYQAPAYKAPETFGIRNVRNYHMYGMLLPPDLNQRLFLTEKSFDSAQLDALRPLWRKVKEALREWRNHYDSLRPHVEGNLLLSMQDGRDYLKIRDFRGKNARFHWLRGPERDVYLECERIISIAELRRRFPGIEAAVMDEWISSWMENKLVFVEKGKLLGLAVPWGAIAEDRQIAPKAVSKRRLEVVNA